MPASHMGSPAVPPQGSGARLAAVPPALECHLLSLADVAAGSPGPRGGLARSIVSRLGRLLLASVLAEHLGAASAADVPLEVAAGGRPVPRGEPATGARAGIAHDRDVLVVGFHPAGCAVDVEDTPVALIAEVAGRFCALDERLLLPAGAAVRGLWSAKEAVAKYTGLGLRAGLRTITFDGDPQAGWVHSRYPGAQRPPLCRVVETPGRHLAFAVGARAATGYLALPTGDVTPVAGATAARHAATEARSTALPPTESLAVEVPAIEASAVEAPVIEVPVIEVHRWVPVTWVREAGGAHPAQLARVALAPAGELTDLARAVAATAPPTSTGREHT
ncbi:4'-phosphopantetheinyl transferase superfamily protein [Frankia sp. AgB32]|uniref:4'-phosphopantetheinyl transferase family protein n=1 Tax=Frankia sp. AgB32 TaxID=631119 RepID=UPI00201086A0|nr:4'-phosphopantetheinyl transferase superfamily protein [Frankia sp. AgB32]MCK9897102.1 4'-phosphopantetheinyl transferase superfamily protein [Frankia sp. AgB32]